MPSYQSRPAAAPRPEQVTPALAKLRQEWYGSNPAKPDWNATAEQQRAAWLTLRDGGRAALTK